MAELDPVPDPSSVANTAPDPMNNQAKICYEKATEIYIEASRSVNIKGLQSTISLCNEALSILALVPGGGDRALLRDVYNRIILSYSLLDDNEKVVELCHVVLRDVYPNDTKTLFKRAIAYEKLGDFENSLQDIEGVLAVYNDPSSKNHREVLSIKTRIQNKSWRMKWLYTYDELLDLYYRYYSVKESNTSIIAQKMAEVRKGLESYLDKEDYKTLNYLSQHVSTILNLNQVTLGRN